MLKRGLIAGISLLVLAIGYLVFPTYWFAGTSLTDSLEPQQQIALVPSDKNQGRRCDAERIYVAEETRHIHEREGYEFTVDDYCADMQKRLLEAISADNINEVRHLIEMGANPATADVSRFDGVYPLAVGAYQDASIVRVLLDNGADVNQEFCCCASCDTPLTKAITVRRADTVKLLLERGASISYKPSWTDGTYDGSAFDRAMESPDAEIVHFAKQACERSVQCRIFSRIDTVLRLARIR
ncbi:MAG: ankyrin repeat domain-containing protein [Pyrinomonadaceae bacterium]